MIHLASHIGFGGAFFCCLIHFKFKVFLDQAGKQYQIQTKVHADAIAHICTTEIQNTIGPIKAEIVQHFFHWSGSGASKMSTSYLVGFCATLVDSCCWNLCVKIFWSCCESKISTLPFWCRRKIWQTRAKCEYQQLLPWFSTIFFSGHYGKMLNSEVFTLQPKEV